MKRPELTELTSADIAPLEAVIAGFPEVWQDLARSHYLTLLGRETSRAPERLAELAQLAGDLARGVGQDIGGRQVYVPVGADFEADERAWRVVRAWRAGQPWTAIAAAEKISDRRARQIVSAWQIETFGRAQGKLPID
ncbi:MAG: Mor transcription activator family protein [Rubrivivax sp.]